MKKIILLILPSIFLTGCVYIKVPDDNACYRYIDYKNEEYIMSYQDNTCYISSGQLVCKDEEKRVRVQEFEIIECPKEG